MRSLILILAVMALLGSVVWSAEAPASFTVCGECHAAVPGVAKDKTGPSLHGVYGRKVASLPGYEYSGGLKKLSESSWNEMLLDRFMSMPSAMAPGTKMPVHITEQTKRLEIIRYLKTLK